VRRAIYQVAKMMVEPPITNLGIKGIRKAGQRIRDWPKVMDDRLLRDACINTCVMIDARGGTGGGLFRYMYGRFLSEAAGLIGEERLHEAGQRLLAAGDRWQVVAELFEQAYEADQPGDLLSEICAVLPEIASHEEMIWKDLREITAD
jgi:hypothetical protein